ncbi:MAG: methyltransferase domain-containing protein [Candidatus Cloacimonetes bacterium]|nr:methyltransferase domain-containing protein [Candidatus Cloacimonadota bacterium]
MKVKENKKNKVQKSFGPVDNFENYLIPDWWKRIFNSMYLKTDGDVVEDENITKEEVSIFTQILKFDKNAIILDLACGQGRHTLELAKRGYTNLYGLDRSRYLIKRAKRIADRERLSVNFKEGDARKLPYPTDTFDFVLILGNSFGYFENLEDDTKILKEVFRVLKPNGLFFIDVADGVYLKDNYSPRSWEWIDKKHFVCRERVLASDNERLISREVITHIEKGVIVDQFYAERLYTKESLSEQLQKARFEEVNFHGSIKTDSQRNQDLGMMEQRLIVTSQVIKEWTPQKVVNKELKNVVVLLGDANFPDKIKPNSTFDKDDLTAIEKLKEALNKLTEYKFIYLANHKTLISDLNKINGKQCLVLNLCDEGYQNLSEKELHIPALLEIFDLPYSGSSPQCLANCYDKSLIRGIAKEMNIPVAQGFLINPEDNIYEINNISFPVIAKPNFADGSFGITKKNVANNIIELNDAISTIRNEFGYNKPILVEEFLSGKEITVGIIGNPPENYYILPLIEEDYSELPSELPKICGYEAKWIEDSPYFNKLKSVKADISEEISQSIITWSLKLSERLNCNDYCRFDWRMDIDEVPKLLEINPNPGWCWDGHLAKMSAIAGINYSEMLRKIITATEQRLDSNTLNITSL